MKRGSVRRSEVDVEPQKEATMSLGSKQQRCYSLEIYGERGRDLDLTGSEIGVNYINTIIDKW